MRDMAAGMNPVRSMLGRSTDASGFNAYAAGAKHYGEGRSAPNIGKTANKTGYATRDAKQATRRDALLNRAKGYL